MVICGVVIHTAIALSTWARGRATAFVDSFNFLPGPLPVEILVQRFLRVNTFACGCDGSSGTSRRSDRGDRSIKSSAA